MKKKTVAILLLSILLVLPAISGVDVEMVDMRYGGTQPIDAEKVEMSTGAYTVYRAGEEEKEKKSPSMVYTYTPRRPITEDYPAVTLIDDYLESEPIGVKKKAGDSIDFGDGYILLMREVNPEVGEVLMELQLDDRTIDEKILRIDEFYELENYNEEPKIIRVIDIYHETMGDYVSLELPQILCMAIPHLNLIISSVPQRADIHIDGQYVGKTTKTIPILDLDMHSLCLKLRGYEDAEQNFQFDPGKEEKEILITLNSIQQATTPTTPPPPQPTLVPHTLSPTPPPEPTPEPNTYSPTPSTPEPPPMAVPHTYSPTASTPATEATPVSPRPTLVPGFWAITVILAILCGYLISKK